MKNKGPIILGVFAAGAAAIWYFMTKGNSTPSAPGSSGGGSSLLTPTLQDWKNFLALNHQTFGVPNNLNTLPDTGLDSKKGWFKSLYDRRNGQRMPGDTDNYGVDLALAVWPKWVTYAQAAGINPYTDQLN